MKRDTNTDLMNQVFKRLKESGHYKKAEAIIDYFLPSGKEGN